ncbi:MAG: nicotinamide riboside transporter PnuC, partial [Clostridia bacterium]|nr:nicotinamide riboside transporter PnuC [Clostridia bacterium]
MKKLLTYFTLTERILWSVSVVAILTSYCLFSGENILSLIASLVGVTSLIFCAKGNPVGQVLM